MNVGEDELSVLSRSNNRTRLLAALNEDQPLDRYELEARIDASRRTVTRVLETLSDRGYVAKREAGYALTAFGSTIVDAHQTYRDTAEVADEFRPFLRRIDSESFDLEPTALRGAELTVATETSPYALLDRVLQLRARSTRIRELAPAIERKSIDQLATRLQSGEDVSVEVILPEAALKEAQTHPEYASGQRIIQESEAVDLFVYPELPSLFIGTMDDTTALGAGVEGRPHALVESQLAELRTWAHAQLDEYRREATPIEEY